MSQKAVKLWESGDFAKGFVPNFEDIFRGHAEATIGEIEPLQRSAFGNLGDPEKTLPKDFESIEEIEDHLARSHANMHGPGSLSASLDKSVAENYTSSVAPIVEKISMGDGRLLNREKLERWFDKNAAHRSEEYPNGIPFNQAWRNLLELANEKTVGMNLEQWEEIDPENPPALVGLSKEEADETTHLSLPQKQLDEGKLSKIYLEKDVHLFGAIPEHSE